MKSPLKKFGRKIVFSAIAGTALLFLMSTHLVRAQSSWNPFSISNIQNSVIATVSYGIGYIIATVMGILIAVEAWLIGVVLNINSGILQSTLVQNGFSISLAFANLAFVLGIIVIAIATILRRESYGIKQLLWKLVIMAILVNFGLVIITPIFAVGTTITQYFVNCIGPANGGCSGTGSGIKSFFTFGTYFVGEFNPQDAFTALGNGGLKGASTSGDVTTAFAGAFSATGLNIAQMIVPIFGIVFVVINVCLIAVVLAVFIILLFIRYIYIAILAILLPLAWASWVFPSFSYHFEAWWKKFLQWTFFAPIAMFFVYLAFQTMNLITPSNAGNNNIFGVSTYTAQGVSSVWDALSQFLGATAFAQVVSILLQEILLVGLIIGGLIAANEMGIKFAGTAVNLGKQGATAVGVWTGKQGIKGARAGWQAMGTHERVTKRLTEGNIGAIGRAPLGVGWLARRASSYLGRGFSNIETNERYVEDAKKAIPSNITKEGWNERREGNLNEQDILAHIAKGDEKGWLKPGMKFNGRAIEDIVDDRSLIERNGAGNLKKDVDVALDGDTNVRNAIRASDRHEATAMVADDIRDERGNIMKDSHGNELRRGAMIETEELKTVASEVFSRGLKTKDAANIDANGVFGPDVKQATLELRIKDLVSNPQNISVVLKNMKSPALRNFEKNYARVIEDEIQTKIPARIAAIQASTRLSAAEKDEKIDELRDSIARLTEANRQLPRSIFMARFGFNRKAAASGRSARPTTPTPPPQPGPTP